MYGSVGFLGLRGLKKFIHLFLDKINVDPFRYSIMGLQCLFVIFPQIKIRLN